MRDFNDLRRAFGEADEAFQDNVFRVLAGLRTEEERKPMKKTRWKLGAAVAAAVLLMAATAFALTNTWGILDFLTSRRQNVSVLPEAEEIVQKDVPQQGGKAAYATFAVREAVYDGKEVFIALEARPTEEQYLLLGPDAYPDNPVGDLGPLFAGKAGTIADYAHETGKSLIHTFAGIDSASCSIDFLLEEDGTLVYLINGRYEAEGKLELTVDCGVAPFVDQDGKMTVDHASLQRTPLTVSLENTGTKRTATSAAAADFASCGVRVERVTMTGSEMGIYVTIEYTVTDEEKYAKTGDGLWFEFLDENGEILPFGAGTAGAGVASDGKTFVQDITLPAAEKLPEMVILRAFNCWTKERYDTCAIDLN